MRAGSSSANRLNILAWPEQIFRSGVKSRDRGHLTSALHSGELTNSWIHFISSPSQTQMKMKTSSSSSVKVHREWELEASPGGTDRSGFLHVEFVPFLHLLHVLVLLPQDLLEFIYLLRHWEEHKSLEEEEEEERGWWRVDICLTHCCRPL